nr:hypothetical protein [Tanacetum cinerariifolium]
MVEMLQQVKQGLSNVIIVKEKDIWLDLEIIDFHDVQPTIIHNAAFQTIDLDAYNSDCDDISSARAVLLANLLSYGSDVLFEVAQHDSYQNNEMLNQSVQEMQNFEQSLIDYVPHNEITSDDFDNVLHNELNEVKMVFNQMETAVE